MAELGLDITSTSALLSYQNFINIYFYQLHLHGVDNVLTSMHLVWIHFAELGSPPSVLQASKGEVGPIP